MDLEQIELDNGSPPYAPDVSNLVRHLTTDLSRGLTTEEAAQRGLQYGSNQLLGESSINPFFLLLRQVTNVMTLILVAAAVTSFATKDYAEGVVVVLVIIINTIIGFFQEYKAEKTMTALRNMSSPTARVLRDGEQQSIATKSLVPGRSRT
jgi:P-type Na+/K+ transporter